MQPVAYKRLVDFGVSVLTKRGVPAGNARYVAEVAAMTEGLGVKTHGMAMLAVAAGKVGSGIDPAGEPKVVSEAAAAAAIDGSGTLGALAMRLAKELAVAKARQAGVATVTVRNTTWLGAVGPYLIDIARSGLLAMATAQSSGCKDCAPVGGIDARFSTNPVALAFPTGGEPVVADFSTAALSMGKIGTMIRAGRKAPEDIFMDRHGVLGDDPAVVNDGGTVLFAGGRNFGHKGYALSLWCEALTVLSGGNANNPDVPQGQQSFALTVIDPAAFAGAEYYLKEMKRFIAHVKSSRPAPGAGAIRLPGERGLAALAEARKNGVTLAENVRDRLNRLAEENGLAERF